MITNFPYTAKITEPRQTQIDCLNWLNSLWDSHDLFVICAPVGIGKGAIGLTIGRSVNRALYTSPLNALVDQTEDSFSEYVDTLKGRKHYPCMAGKDNCAVGFCQVPGTCQVDGSIRTCSGKELLKKCEACACRSCTYREAFYKFKSSKLGNTNFSLYLLGVTNLPDTIIIDEADQIENFARLHYTFTFETKLRSEWNLTIKDLDKYQSRLISELDIVENLLLKEQAKDKPRKYSLDSYTSQINRINRESEHIITVIADYEANEEEWAVSYKDNKTILQPVTIDRFVEPLLKDKKVVLMSATLSPELKKQGYQYLEVPSPFDPKIRPWRFIPIGRMSRDYRDKTIPLIAKHLLGLPDGKTIVHCHSYEIAKNIGKMLEKQGVYPLVQVNGVQTQYHRNVKRYEAIQQFKASENPGEILLSVNLTRGIDLPELDIINNIIVVLPFPNPVDPLVKKKNKVLGKAWQGLFMAQEIQQTYGRVNRNDMKTTNTEILDTNWRWWFKQNRKHFSNWFLEAQKR